VSSRAWSGRVEREARVPSIVVVYGTTEGHTRRVARRAAERLRSHGWDVSLHDATGLDRPLEPQGVAAVMVLASVHHGRHQSSVIHFIHANVRLLESVPSAFVSVSLTAALPEESYQDEASAYVEQLLDATNWRPSHTLRLAGALKYARYDFFKRLLLGLLERSLGPGVVRGEDAEFTDWGALDVFVDAFVAERLAFAPRGGGGV
jgi:menaquinone-dependent protoporphyrinogen oxidase